MTTITISTPMMGATYVAGDTIAVNYTYTNAPADNYEVYVSMIQKIEGVDQSPSIQPISPDQFITGAYNYVTSNKAIAGNYYICMQMIDYNGGLTEGTVYKSPMFTVTAI